MGKTKRLMGLVLAMAMTIANMQVATVTKAYDGQPLGYNVAANKTIILSDAANALNLGNAKKMIDNNDGTGYQAVMHADDEKNDKYDPQFYVIDLGNNFDIDRISLNWEASAAEVYDLYVSSTNEPGSWTKVATEKAGHAGDATYTFAPVNARYVKLDMQYRLLNYGYFLYEFRVFTVGSAEEKQVKNLALSATATASADDGNNTADRINDGVYGTMWRTEYDDTISEEERANHNVTLKWATAQTFDVVKVHWFNGYMKGYKLQTSDDGTTWTDIAEVKNATPSEYKSIKLNAPVTTKYLRLQGVTFGAYCFEIREFEVYNETGILPEKLFLQYANIKLNNSISSENTRKIDTVISPSNAHDQSINWTSSNENIVKVAADGTITGVGVGRAVITATCVADPSVKATCNVSVSKKLDSPTVVANKLPGTKDIKLTWTSVSHAGKYKLVKKTVNRSIPETVIYEGTGNTFTDLNIVPGTYSYYVEAVVDANYADADLLSNSVSAYTESILIPVDVEGVTITSSAQVEATKNITLEYLVSPLSATDRSVVFESSDTKIATVNEKGTVTGIKPGTTTITVTTKDGGYKAQCKLTVFENLATSVNITGESKYTLKTGTSQQLYASVWPDTTTFKELTWTSDNANVAKVDSTGYVTAVSAGTAHIYATAKSGVRAEYTIVVKISPTSVVIDQPNPTIYVGSYLKLNATVLPTDTTNKAVKWISSNDLVATVDAFGNVKGVTEGVAFISAQTIDGQIIGSSTVTVLNKVVTKPKKVTLKSAKAKGKKVTLKWKKVTDAVGYQIYVKINKDSFVLLKTITKGTKVSYTGKFKAGNKYSFKVRAYKLDDGEKVVGTYSKVKSVKIK